MPVSVPDQNPNALGTFVFNQRFPGQVFDAETGNFQNSHREYSPLIGRYIESDPIGLGGGINTYGYVGGDPLNKIDPSGLQIVLPGGLPLPGVGGASAEQNKALAKSLARAMENNDPKKTYQTYTRYNPRTNQCYSGRTSGYGTPQQNIQARGAGQPLLNAEGFNNPVLDRSSDGSSSIRGREQQLIDINGGAQSSGGYSRNKINGVSPMNPAGLFYDAMATSEFGPAVRSGQCTCD